MRTTIVLAEPQYLVRRGIRCLVEREANFKVVGEVTDGLEAVRLVQRLKPRVLIVDVAIPGLNGIETTRQVHQQSPNVIQALKNGASGYVVKHAKPAELMRAIREVVAGRCYLSEPLSERPLQTWLQRAKSAPRDTYETLTPREREVLQLVAEGHSSVTIASRLSIGRRTAESHRANIMRKLHLGNQINLILFAIARGIVALPSDPLRDLPRPTRRAPKRFPVPGEVGVTSITRSLTD